MSEAEPVYRVERRDDDDDAVEIGRVSIGPKGQMKLVETEPVFEAALAGIIEAVNATESPRIKVPSPPEAEPGGVFRRTVSRDDSDIIEALQEFMEQKYDLHLVPDQE